LTHTLSSLTNIFLGSDWLDGVGVVSVVVVEEVDLPPICPRLCNAVLYDCVYLFPGVGQRNVVAAVSSLNLDSALSRVCFKSSSTIQPLYVLSSCIMDTMGPCRHSDFRPQSEVNALTLELRVIPYKEHSFTLD